MCEGLRRELAYSNVKVKTVCPWLVDSGMFTGIKSFFIPSPSPKYAAECIVEGITRNVRKSYL